MKKRKGKVEDVKCPNIVRLGHPARMSDWIKTHCLEALIESHEGTEIVRGCEKGDG